MVLMTLVELPGGPIKVNSVSIRGPAKGFDEFQFDLLNQIIARGWLSVDVIFPCSPIPGCCRPQEYDAPALQRVRLHKLVFIAGSPCFAQGDHEAHLWKSFTSGTRTGPRAGAY